jgi:hypothetical protein
MTTIDLKGRLWDIPAVCGNDRESPVMDEAAIRGAAVVSQ